jgi:hypothetical protein
LGECRVAVEGGSLWCEVQGGGMAVALLHAAMGDAGMWDDQMDVFARDFTVVATTSEGSGARRYVRGRSRCGATFWPSSTRTRSTGPLS